MASSSQSGVDINAVRQYIQRVNAFLQQYRLMVRGRAISALSVFPAPLPPTGRNHHAFSIFFVLSSDHTSIRLPYANRTMSFRMPAYSVNLRQQQTARTVHFQLRRTAVN